jgi:hypothetical protein
MHNRTQANIGSNALVICDGDSAFLANGRARARIASTPLSNSDFAHCFAANQVLWTSATIACVVGAIGPVVDTIAQIATNTFTGTYGSITVIITGLWVRVRRG